MNTKIQAAAEPISMKTHLVGGRSHMTNHTPCLKIYANVLYCPTELKYVLFSLPTNTPLKGNVLP